MKFLLVLLPLLALCSAQIPLPNTATLDDGNFIIRWGLIGNTGWAEIEVQANCTGWVSIMLVSADGSKADVHLGGYLEEYEVGYLHDMHLNLTSPHGLPEDDASNDLILQGAIFHDPWTIIRMKRAANTGDVDDVPIVGGNMTLGWAYSNSNNVSVPHDKAGTVVVQLLPPAAPTTAAPTTAAPTTAAPTTAAPTTAAPTTAAPTTAAPTTAAPTTAAPTTAAPTTAGTGSLSNSIPMALTLLALCWSLI